MISSDTYEEVYTILSYMDKLTVMKIPESILNTIKEKRNKQFKTQIEKDDIFNERNVSRETIDFLCWLDYKYWMDQEQKSEIDKINSGIYKKEYDSKNIFKNNTEKINIVTNDTEITKVKEKNIIRKIIDTIKKFFNK